MCKLCRTDQKLAGCPNRLGRCLLDSETGSDVLASCANCGDYINCGDYYYELSDGQTLCGNCLYFDDTEYIAVTESGCSLSYPEHEYCCLCGAAMDESGFYTDSRTRRYCAVCVTPLEKDWDVGNNCSGSSAGDADLQHDPDDWRCDQRRGR